MDTSLTRRDALRVLMVLVVAHVFGVPLETVQADDGPLPDIVIEMKLPRHCRPAGAPTFHDMGGIELRDGQPVFYIFTGKHPFPTQDNWEYRPMDPATFRAIARLWDC